MLWTTAHTLCGKAYSDLSWELKVPASHLSELRPYMFDWDPREPPLAVFLRFQKKNS